jgi:hypothetical protein
MDQDIITPPATPKTGQQAFSPFGCFIAAAGATLTSFTLLGAAAAASVWAFAKLLGLPDMVLYVCLALSAMPVLWATAWTAGRAWHVERRLAQGLDIDVPVFKFAHYFKVAR